MSKANRVLVNSMPKSGTHLLARVVEQFGFTRFPPERGLWQRATARLGLAVPSALAHGQVSRHWRYRMSRRPDDGRPEDHLPVGVISPLAVPVGLVASWLDAAPDRSFFIGHLPWSEHADSLLRQLRYHHVLIIRDPRAVLVSYLHFLLRPAHPLSADFRRFSADERVAFAMEGGPAPMSGRPVVGLRDAFKSVTSWRRSPNALIVRFEDLVGERGGGSQAAQRRAVRAIADYLQIDCDGETTDRIGAVAFDTGSATFRKGQVASWQDELSGTQLETYGEHCDENLRALHFQPDSPALGPSA